MSKGKAKKKKPLTKSRLDRWEENLPYEEREELKKNTFQNHLKQALKSVARTKALIIRQEVLMLCECNYTRAAVLSHLIYLCDKGGLENGYIWKSAKDWKRETGLSRYEVHTATTKLKEKGLVEFKVQRQYGRPIMHFHLNQKELIMQIANLIFMETKILTKKMGHENTPLSSQLQKRFLDTMKEKVN